MGFWITLGGIILVVVSVVVVAIKAWRQQNRFKKEGKAVEGVILDHYTGTYTNKIGATIRESIEYKVTYQYRYHEGTYTASESVNKDLYDVLQIGRKISLLCLPTNPEKVRIEFVLAKPIIDSPEEA